MRPDFTQVYYVVVAKNPQGIEKYIGRVYYQNRNFTIKLELAKRFQSVLQAEAFLFANHLDGRVLPVELTLRVVL